MKKLLICFVLSLCLFSSTFLFQNPINSYAAETETVTMPLSYEDAFAVVFPSTSTVKLVNFPYYLCGYVNGHFIYMYSKKPIVKNGNSFCSVDDNQIYWCHISSSGVDVGGGGYQQTLSSMNDFSLLSSSNVSLLATNFDIVNYSDGTVVFPLPVPVLSQAQLIQQVPLTPVLSQIQFLAAFLIVSIVGFLAFRKAWVWLKTELLMA